MVALPRLPRQGLRHCHHHQRRSRPPQAKSMRRAVRSGNVIVEGPQSPMAVKMQRDMARHSQRWTDGARFLRTEELRPSGRSVRPWTMDGRSQIPEPQAGGRSRPQIPSSRTEDGSVKIPSSVLQDEVFPSSALQGGGRDFEGGSVLQDDARTRATMRRSSLLLNRI